jgi:hypothetical protein
MSTTFSQAVEMNAGRSVFSTTPWVAGPLNRRPLDGPIGLCLVIRTVRNASCNNAARDRSRGRVRCPFEAARCSTNNSSRPIVLETST